MTQGINGNIVGVADITTVLDATLRDNGGPTQTLALASNSPAINAGTDDAGVHDLDTLGPSDLEAYYQFSEAVGATVANDASGQQRHATYQGGITLGQDGHNAVDRWAASFDGINDYVDAPDGFDDFTGGITVAAWVYPTAVKDWARIIDFGNGEATDNILLTRVGGSGGNDVVLTVFEAPPTIVDVLVGSSNWTNEFRTTALGATGGYYRVPSDLNQLRPIPWAIDEVRVVFSQRVNVSQDDLVITGVNSATSQAQSLSYEEATTTATWTIPVVDIGKILLNLNDVIAAVDTGLALDGEYTTFTGLDNSGDKLQGGDFHFRIDVLSGDASGDGEVGTSDLDPIRDAFLSSPDDGSYNLFADLTGDALVGSTDLIPIGDNFNESLPNGSPNPHDFDPLPGVHLLVNNADRHWLRLTQAELPPLSPPPPTTFSPASPGRLKIHRPLAIGLAHRARAASSAPRPSQRLVVCR